MDWVCEDVREVLGCGTGAIKESYRETVKRRLVLAISKVYDKARLGLYDVEAVPSKECYERAKAYFYDIEDLYNDDVQDKGKFLKYIESHMVWLETGKDRGVRGNYLSGSFRPSAWHREVFDAFKYIHAVKEVANGNCELFSRRDDVLSGSAQKLVEDPEFEALVAIQFAEFENLTKLKTNLFFY